MTLLSPDGNGKSGQMGDLFGLRPPISSGSDLILLCSQICSDANLPVPMDSQLVNCKSSLACTLKQMLCFGARAVRVSQNFNKNQFYFLHNVQRSRSKEVTMLRCYRRGENAFWAKIRKKIKIFKPFELDPPLPVF